MILPMAKRKDGKPEGPKLKDILKPIMPRFIDQMLRCAGNITQAELGHKLDVDAGTISRYRSGKVVPLTNLPALGEEAGLSLENTAWLLGYLLVEENQAASFDLGGQADEVREPQHRYGEHSLTRGLAEVMALDFRALEPHETVKLNLERNVLRDACREVLSGNERLVQAHLALLSSFKDRCETALAEARARRRS